MATLNPQLNKMVARHFWEVSKRFKREIILVWFIAVQSFFIGTLVPFWIGKILATLGHPGQEPLHYLPVLIGTIVIGVTSNYIGFKALFRLQPKVMKALETEALDALLNRSVGFHNNHIAGKLVADATQYPTSYGQLSNALFVNILQFVVTLITGILIIMLHSWQLGLLVIVMTVSVIGLAIYQTVSKNDDRIARHRARQKMVAHLADTVTNAVTVKTFAQEKREMTDHEELMKTIAWHRTRDWTRLASEGSRRIGVLLSFEVVFIVLIVHLVNQDPRLLAIGIFTFSYAINLAAKLFDIGSLFRTVEDSLTDAGDMMAIVAGQAEVVDATDATELIVSRGAIEFKDVGFRYDDAAKDDTVFEHLDIAIKPGEKIGLVGPSGGGKTTLTRLLLRFEDIQQGTISIDGQSISAVTQASLRQAIAYVPQEPLLFHRSIAQNIGFGVPGVSDEDIVEAARKAHALEFIEALPAGFDTTVGERGVKLSGGQRQRIAIARAILKNAPVLVLDEATSALDSESEAAVQEALKALIADRTTLVIAHRLSTIQKMDRIIVLKNGAIAEQGSHQELLKHKGVYAKLWGHQSGGFIED